MRSNFKVVKPVMRKYFSGGRVVYAFDKEKSSFRDLPLKDLGAYGRRKFENLIFLENTRENPVIRYE